VPCDALVPGELTSLAGAWAGRTPPGAGPSRGCQFWRPRSHPASPGAHASARPRPCGARAPRPRNPRGSGCTPPGTRPGRGAAAASGWMGEARNCSGMARRGCPRDSRQSSTVSRVPAAACFRGPAIRVRRPRTPRRAAGSRPRPACEGGSRPGPGRPAAGWGTLPRNAHRGRGRSGGSGARRSGRGQLPRGLRRCGRVPPRRAHRRKVVSRTLKLFEALRGSG
jgi:hypothetical protein